MSHVLTEVDEGAFPAPPGVEHGLYVQAARVGPFRRCWAGVAWTRPCRAIQRTPAGAPCTTSWAPTAASSPRSSSSRRRRGCARRWRVCPPANAGCCTSGAGTSRWPRSAPSAASAASAFGRSSPPRWRSSGGAGPNGVSVCRRTGSVGGACVRWTMAAAGPARLVHVKSLRFPSFRNCSAHHNPAEMLLRWSNEPLYCMWYQ